MTVKEKANDWGCKPDWVRKRCRENMIPTAYKTRGKWEIPEDAEKPPCTAERAVVILENLLEIQVGNKAFPYSPKTRENSSRIIRYLSREGFISLIHETEDLDYALRHVSVLKRGMNLIASVREESVKEKEESLDISAGIDVGIAKTSIRYGRKTLARQEKDGIQKR